MQTSASEYRAIAATRNIYDELEELRESKHMLLNTGHYAASLHHVLGTMSASIEKALKKDDITSQRMAERKHVLREGGKKNYRVKRKCMPKNKEGPSYDTGSEPI